MCVKFLTTMALQSSTLEPEERRRRGAAGATAAAAAVGAGLTGEVPRSSSSSSPGAVCVGTGPDGRALGSALNVADISGWIVEMGLKGAGSVADRGLVPNKLTETLRDAVDAGEESSFDG